ncbi:TetR/AcrR family transcriptional regulator [Mycobacterium sherrisii]|uniref:TetR/AcrR family transcriptional regulator n=1 Tax=Mycobacterium sherrisii TaxID=243061 RepID=UPI001301BC40|nr:TetR family transcriptional regulator [Mycobacterium sherrisii]MCV7032401.1 TetR family transcriptional regulator [Mycobacterium sherrisii]
MAHSSGLSTRSQHRRRAVLRSTVAVLRRRGFDAVTSRAVAQEGGLPEQTVRAFYASRDDLLAAGLKFMLNGWIEQANDFVKRLPCQLGLNETARLITEVATVHPAEDGSLTRATISGVYERYLQAGKHSELTSLIGAYNEILAGLVAQVLARNGRSVGPQVARAVLAVADGTVLYELAAGENPVPRAIEMLEFAIPRLCAPASSAP